MPLSVHGLAWEPALSKGRHSAMRMSETEAMRLALVALAVLALSSCNASERSAPSNNHSHLTVHVSTGIEAGQAVMEVANSPVAQYFPRSDKIVFVSNPRYSSTCPPEGEAQQNGGTITLTVRDSDGNCTSDAVRDTFLIEHVTSDPRQLVVVQAGHPDVRLDLSS